MPFRPLRSPWRALWLSSLVLGVVACAPLDDRPAPIDDRSVGRVGASIESPRSSVPEYVVRRGDTLYAIAFRNGVDYRDLARWNAIADPFVIQPGQRLRLGPPDAQGARPAASVAMATETGRIQPVAEPAPARMEPLPDRPLPPENRDAVNPVAAGRPSTSGAAPAPAPAGADARPAPTVQTTTAPAGNTQGSQPVVSAPAPATGSTPAAAAAMPANPTIVSGGAERTVEGVRWRWPADGRVISTFVVDDPTRQGIDIMGTEGQQILAAAGGEVVYSGSGLIGYGELIIIKHTDNLLSAYGHNRRRLVEEGTRVRSGQVIAEMGRSGGSVPMLHFEIRRSGRPADPRGFLPQR
jgi:lipoprotein NlpD